MRFRFDTWWWFKSPTAAHSSVSGGPPLPRLPCVLPMQMTAVALTFLLKALLSDWLHGGTLPSLLAWGRTPRWASGCCMKMVRVNLSLSFFVFAFYFWAIIPIRQPSISPVALNSGWGYANVTSPSINLCEPEATVRLANLPRNECVV